MKKIIFFINIIFISYFCISQNADYKIVQKKDKIYYNRNLPVYVWISTSQDNNSNDILLTSSMSKNYTNPMYFDSEGYNTFNIKNAVDTTTKKIAYPSQTVSFKVYVDGYAPTVNSKFIGTRKQQTNGTYYYKSGLKIELFAKDFMSGIESIFFSINMSDFQKYKEPLLFNTTGEFLLKYYALDYTGNKSEIKNHTFIIK